MATIVERRSPHGAYWGKRQENNEGWSEAHREDGLKYNPRALKITSGHPAGLYHLAVQLRGEEEKPLKKG